MSACTEYEYHTVQYCKQSMKAAFAEESVVLHALEALPEHRSMHSGDLMLGFETVFVVSDLEAKIGIV